MGDVLVEQAPLPPHKKPLSSLNSANTDTASEFLSSNGEDSYSSYKKLQRELEYIHLQEEYIKDEQRYEL